MHLIARWMGVGFIHGVMNTDNMSISGETLDFGPCAFMDYFNFNQVYSYIDRQGRYAYGEQPHILMWNLARLADTLIPLMGEDNKSSIEKLQGALSEFPGKLQNEIESVLGQKLGLRNLSPETSDLTESWLRLLHRDELDFTLAHYHLEFICQHQSKVEDFFPTHPDWKDFFQRWKAMGPSFSHRHNPLYIPRNHLIEKVIAAAYVGDFDLFFKMHEQLKKPMGNEFNDFSKPPKEDEIIQNTFCGT
jgi:uncharacterized protein YdiU (UPF0061 family)